MTGQFIIDTCQNIGLILIGVAVILHGKNGHR